MTYNIINILSKNKLNSIKILDIQNLSLFIIGWYSFFLCLYYNLTYLSDGNVNYSSDIIIHFDTISIFILLYTLIDFVIIKSYISILHHACVCGIIFYNFYYNITPEYKIVHMYPLLKTEISSIFYIMTYYLPNKSIIYNVNNILFYIFFIKFRIYDFYYEIIYNNIYFDILFKKYSEFNYLLSSILLVSCYVLYILNLYWFLILNKIIYKIIQNFININTDILCHKICSYLHWINLPLIYYVYQYDINKKNIFDIIGIIILSITSYKYHNDIYTRLYYKKIEDYYIPDKQNMLLFLNNMLAINTRSFLVIVTNYYNSGCLFFVICISGVFFFLSSYNCIVNILKLFIEPDNNKCSFYRNHNIHIFIPIVIDTLLVCINCPVEILIPFLLVNIFLILILVIEPFYKLTHVFFHILLIIQNYYICLSSSIK
jgi:hypothetical protein